MFKSHNLLLKGILIMKYVKPTILLLSETEVTKHITASASCVNALCNAGGTYTCGKTITYSCSNYSGTPPISCPATFSFSCPSNLNHTDSIGGVMA